MPGITYYPLGKLMRASVALLFGVITFFYALVGSLHRRCVRARLLHQRAGCCTPIYKRCLGQGGETE
ncbi:hypothetical protein VTI74DRAFT_5212 [Chaetomium olivicolor]